MHDPALVRGAQCLGDLSRDRERLLDRQGTVRDSRGQGLALDQLEHQRVRAIALFEAVDGRDVRMIQGRQELRFALEPGEMRRIGSQAVAEDLDRDAAVELGVAPAIHLAHGARAERGVDLVSAEPTTLAKRHGISPL